MRKGLENYSTSRKNDMGGGDGDENLGDGQDIDVDPSLRFCRAAHCHGAKHGHCEG